MGVAYFLGIDIGTYSSKGVLVKESGEVVASHVVPHQLEMPKPGWAEHDAEAVWWNDFLEITQTLLRESGVPPSQILGAGFSAISPAVLPIDKYGIPLRKAILYGIDTRATQEIAWLQQVVDGDARWNQSGIRYSTQSAAPKVLWIRRHEPDVWAKTHRIVNGSGFLLHRLTGQNTIDLYDATSFAPFLDADRRCFSPEINEYVAPVDMLPRLTWTCEVAGLVTAEGARVSGLAEGMPIITGTADAAAEAISAGLTKQGDMMVMYGSSIFFILRTSTLLVAPSFWAAPFLEPGTSVLAGGMATSGSLTRWFREQFAPKEVQAEKNGGVNAYQALANLAGDSPIGSNGLVILPYFAGERTPILDPDARGVIMGLTLRHTRADIYRALLEAVGYGILHNIDVMKKEGANPERVLAVGGGTYNRLWLQIVSDIANIEQQVPDQQIGASYGDAFLAGVGAGFFSSTAEISQWVKPGMVIKPNPAAHERYQPYYQLYRDLYSNTAQLLHRLNPLV